MPILDLKTNLKSLRFGQDRPGSGTSAYTSKVLAPLSPNKSESFDLPLSEIGQTGGTDFIIRGGKYAYLDSRKDASRIRRLFTDTNTGISFLAKQEVLGLTGQRYGAGGPTLGLQAEGVYSSLNTILQVGTNAFGIHGNKQGINPYPTSIFGLNLNQGGRPTYLDYVYGSLTYPTPAENPVFNRLVHLSQTAPLNTSGIMFSYNGGPNSNLGISGQTLIKFSQGNRTGKANPNLGGSIDKTIKFFSTELAGYNDYSAFKNPRRVITRGSTIFSGTPVKWKTASGLYFDAMLPINPSDAIKVGEGYKKDNLEGALRDFDNNVYKPGGLRTNEQVAFPTFAATLTQEQLSQQSPVSRGGQIQDFRKKVTVNQVIARSQGTLTDAPNYENPAVRLEQRVNLGDPGGYYDRSDYTKGALDPNTKQVNVVDKINALYMYEKGFVTNNRVKNDFVKFRFAVINPENPSLKTFIHFRAIFNGGITDNMIAGWNSFKYLGRGEDFYHYTGFSRDISLSFTVVAQSKPELSIMYQKLNYLQSTLAPNFSSNGFMRGNIHQLTVGGYLYELPGVITTLNYTIPDDSTWEIGIPSNFKDAETAPDQSGIIVDPSVKELAHRMEVNLTFKPIHEFLPQTIGSAYDRVNNPNGINGKNSIKQRFLQLTNDGDTNGNNSLYSKGVPFATKL